MLGVSEQFNPQYLMTKTGESRSICEFISSHLVVAIPVHYKIAMFVASITVLLLQSPSLMINMHHMSLRSPTSACSSITVFHLLPGSSWHHSYIFQDWILSFGVVSLVQHQFFMIESPVWFTNVNYISLVKHQVFGASSSPKNSPNLLPRCQGSCSPRLKPLGCAARSARSASPASTEASEGDGWWVGLEGVQPKAMASLHKLAMGMLYIIWM